MTVFVTEIVLNTVGNMNCSFTCSTIDLTSLVFVKVVSTLLIESECFLVPGIRALRHRSEVNKNIRTPTGCQL